MPDGKVVFREQVKGHKIKVDNLEIARTYEFEVVCGDESAKRTFHTKAHGPRFVTQVPPMSEKRSGRGNR